MSQASEGQEDSADGGTGQENVQPDESEALVENSQSIEEQSDIEGDLEDQSLDESSESGDEAPEEEAL